MASVAHTKPVSSIAVAFAIQSASSNIPIPQDGGLIAAGGAHSGALPTPPNSISPTLPATKCRPGMPMAGRVHTPPQGDMDIDLQDAVEHAAAQDQPASALSKEALAGLDATRQITALLLAKHHLPGIILGHGAMPIREMMAHLTQSVPGFSRLPPAKARRLVVAALEHRAGGGLHGEVKFEKVGWGRWSVAGQSSQNKGVPIGGHDASSRNGPTPPASMDSAGGLQIPKIMRHERDMYSGSWAAGSPDSRDEEMADQMSLDGSDDSSTDSDPSDMDLEEDLNDDTDQEDWSNMGPDQLREQRRGPRREIRDYNYLSARYRSASAQHSLAQAQARSMPLSRDRRALSPMFNTSLSYSASRGNAADTLNNITSSGVTTGSGTNVGGQTAERDAIEALVAMGCSM